MIYLSISHLLTCYVLFLFVFIEIGGFITHRRHIPPSLLRYYHTSEKASINNESKTNYSPIELMNQHPYRVGVKPASAFVLAKNNFVKEFNQMVQSINVFKEKHPTLPECLELQLSDEKVKEAEREREKRAGIINVNPVAKALFSWSCRIIDTFFQDRPIPKFWVLETVARVPYFSFVSMLHLYETLGWWRQPSLRQIHSAEEYNELHHLLIMESLGGDKLWKDRLLGYHCAILYYWLIIATYLFSPKVAYQFMELLEAHANDTYAEFVIANEDVLKSIPPPDIAVSYYTGADLYQFDQFQVGTKPGTRRPPCDSLYDVFVNIRDDEAEHISTMKACQNYATLGDLVISPHIQFQGNDGDNDGDDRDDSSNSDNNSTKRDSWKEWAKRMNDESTQPVSN